MQTLAPPAGIERTSPSDSHGLPDAARSPETTDLSHAKSPSEPFAPPAALTPGLGPYRLLTAIYPSRPHPRVIVGAGAGAHSTFK